MGTHGNVRRQSRKAALCGLLTALAAVMLSLGGMIPFAGVVCPVLAMFCLLPAVCDYSAGTALVQYAATAVLGLLLCPDPEASLLYVFLGWYPVLRPGLAKLGKLRGTLIKTGIFALALTGMYALILFIFRLDAVVAEFAEYSAPMVIGLLALSCAVFLLCDRTMGILTLAYRQRRKRHLND